MSQGPEFGALIGSCSSISGVSFSCSLNALREQIKAQFLQCHRQCEADILSFLLVHPLSQHQPTGLLPTAVTELWVICVPEAKSGSQLLPPPSDVRGDQVHFTLLQVRGEELSRRGLKHLLLNCKWERKDRVCVIKNVCEERMCVPTSESQSHTHTLTSPVHLHCSIRNSSLVYVHATHNKLRRRQPIYRTAGNFWQGIYFGGLVILRAIRQYFHQSNFYNMMPSLCKRYNVTSSTCVPPSFKMYAQKLQTSKNGTK